MHSTAAAGEETPESCERNSAGPRKPTDCITCGAGEERGREASSTADRHQAVALRAVRLDV
jgi:hypothetical protein